MNRKKVSESTMNKLYKGFKIPEEGASLIGSMLHLKILDEIKECSTVDEVMTLFIVEDILSKMLYATIYLSGVEEEVKDALLDSMEEMFANVGFKLSIEKVNRVKPYIKEDTIDNLKTAMREGRQMLEDTDDEEEIELLKKGISIAEVDLEMAKQLEVFEDEEE